jgi:iron(III) transport system substrate-binding protein
VACALAVALVATLASTAGASTKPKKVPPTTVAGATTTAVWQAVIAAAKKEGKVTVSSALPDTTNTAVAAVWNKVYPDITLQITRVDSGVQGTRADAEFQARQSGADVLLNTDQPWMASHAIRPGFLVPIVGPDVQALPDVLINNTQSVITEAVPAGFAYNPNAVKGTPKLLDVLKPKYKGRIGIPNPDNGRASTLAQYLGYADKYGSGFFKKVAANKPKLYDNSITALQAVAAGEIDFFLMAAAAAVPAGSPVKVGYDEKPLATPLEGVILGLGRNQNAAQLFLNFIMTKDAQEVWSAGAVTPRHDVKSAAFVGAAVTMLNVGAYDTATLDATRAKYSALMRK